MAHDYATTTDCLLQNLTMTVGNPSARCYANAPWRAFTWTCALLQETSAQPWGTLQEAVQESLDTAEPVDLQQLPGLQDLWHQHDLNVQGDASHFVNSLWLQSQTRAFHYRRDQRSGYLVDHVQLPILVPYPDDWPEDVTFQDLISNWANQGVGQYLMDDKRVLICHVTRNTCVDGTATKHNKPFNPCGNFKVPRSLDGFARASTEFVLAVLICHRGPSHHTGLYFAILIYRRDLMRSPQCHGEHGASSASLSWTNGKGVCLEPCTMTEPGQGPMSYTWPWNACCAKRFTRQEDITESPC